MITHVMRNVMSPSQELSNKLEISIFHILEISKYKTKYFRLRLYDEVI